MVRISPERKNQTSPYKVSAAKKENTVKFTTDFGVSYTIDFELTDILSCAETYEFAITNLNNKRSPSDNKLRETIMAVVYDFFLASETAMLYICDTGGGKQAMRDRLFRYWAAINPQRKEFSIWTGSVVDEDGVLNYATIIIRNDHPHRREVIAEFMATIDALNDKPHR